MLIVENLSYTYTDTPVLENINFTLFQGEILSIVGASGSGKSTLLKAIYGLFDLSQGKIFWNGTPVLGPSHNLVPGFPKMKYLAQDFGLMPYMTVEENVGKFLSNLDLPKKRARVAELLEMTLMQDYAKVKPLFLSGGQKQRVALARAMMIEPKIIGYDEPTSALDPELRLEVEKLILKNRELGITQIVVTHDLQFAENIADSILKVEPK